MIVRGEIATRILFTYRSWILRYSNAHTLARIHTAPHTHIYLSKIKYPIRTQYIILDAPFYYFVFSLATLTGEWSAVFTSAARVCVSIFVTLSSNPFVWFARLFARLLVRSLARFVTFRFNFVPHSIAFLLFVGVICQHCCTYTHFDSLRQATGTHSSMYNFIYMASERV